MAVEAILTLEKTTKRTYVYSTPQGEAPKIRTIYVEQYVLPSAPKKIRVTIEEVEE